MESVTDEGETYSSGFTAASSGYNSLDELLYTSTPLSLQSLDVKLLSHPLALPPSPPLPPTQIVPELYVPVLEATEKTS